MFFLPHFFFFFFSSRRRHTRYWRDWSSDVCSPDLGAEAPLRVPAHEQGDGELVPLGEPGEQGEHQRVDPPLVDVAAGGLRKVEPGLDRKSGVEGKRVDLGGGRIIKKKKKKKEHVAH